MRGRRDPQGTMLVLVDIEERVPKDPVSGSGANGVGRILGGHGLQPGADG